ncbi:MAG: hypothetical protein ACK5RG_14430 [Cyclobacteriaceae bacterium]
MEKQTDSGYPVSVANLATLINLCAIFGAKYKPIKFAIKLENLKALLDRVKISLTVVDEALEEMSSAIKMRLLVFSELEALVTRIMGAVGSSDILTEKEKKFASIVRKFRGSRATAVAEPKPTTTTDAVSPDNVKINSTAQRSFDRKADNFSELVTFLKGEPNYQTDELDLTVDALLAMVSELEARNEAVRKTKSAYIKARIDRNKLFFEPVNGLVPCTKAVKKYVKSVFKAKSPEFEAVSGIAFKVRK